MKVKWECSDCGDLNQTELTHWKIVKDGQGFQDSCGTCDAEVEVDIEVNTRTV